jgi:hypothetical protein
MSGISMVMPKEKNILRQSRCHKSQFTEEEMSDKINVELVDNSFTSYFRKFTVDTNIVNDIFD